MPKLNPALFEPLKRIGKSAAGRAGLRARINEVISSFIRRATNRSSGLQVTYSLIRHSQKEFIDPQLTFRVRRRRKLTLFASRAREFDSPDR
jgi:hypothetical protein